MPFALRHCFADNPLLTLAAHRRTRARICRATASNTIPARSPSARTRTLVPTLDLDPEEIVRKIETCGAWMVLKHIEAHAGLSRADRGRAAGSRQRPRPCQHSKQRASRTSRDFCSCPRPNSTTPFHADSDENFFFQIHGEKFFHVYDNSDRSIASEAALEDVRGQASQHAIRADIRRQTHDLSICCRATACFVPYQWPHWVRTAGSYSISLSVTWKSDEVRRRNDIFTVNSMLRSFGMPQKPPGVNAALDNAKVAMFRAATGAVAPLRRSEGVRACCAGSRSAGMPTTITGPSAKQGLQRRRRAS